MSRGKRNFFSSRKTKYGHVILRDNIPTKMLGEGDASLGDEKTNVTDVLLVDMLKYNILSMIQMVDGGDEVIFNPRWCYIRKERSK